LPTATDLRTALQRCHDRVHRRGATEDAPLTIMRVLLALWRDGQRRGRRRFRCTAEEYASHAGRRAAAARVEDLFAEVRAAHPQLFDAHECIGGSVDEIVDIVVELQDHGVDDGALGAAYEEFTSTALKREGGEFFTNRLIVDLLLRMVDPAPHTVMLDPAGGAGGFAVAVWRYLRRQRRRGAACLIDKNARLVQLARAALLLAGCRQPRAFQADGLLPPARLPAALQEQCVPGKLTLVMTNPPWAGLSGGRITDPLLLHHYDVARRWCAADGVHQPTAELVTGGVPPEYLFVERCIRWLAPGGQLAIVLPKGVLDNLEPALAVRHYLFRHCRVLAVINCHKNAFQPYTGARGCLLVAQKKARPSDARDYSIFMAINRKIGQDSEGVPIFKKDEHGKPTAIVDHDLEDILASWQAHQKGTLQPSEYAFAIDGAALDADTLRVNPQFFLPALNDSLRRVVALDGAGFVVERLGDRIAARIWKGTRFKREDLETDRPGQNTVVYHTPSSIFMRGENAKLLDLSRCGARRRELILAHQARVGELLVTRSGSVGRVAHVGASLDGAVLSDDLVRIWIEDRDLRAFVYALLRSPAGQDQMRRNEYGTVQQHLEPAHIADLLVPLPSDRAGLSTLTRHIEAALAAKENAQQLEVSMDAEFLALLGWRSRP
jgi:type I restriction enzyme M protein